MERKRFFSEIYMNSKQCRNHMNYEQWTMNIVSERQNNENDLCFKYILKIKKIYIIC